MRGNAAGNAIKLISRKGEPLGIRLAADNMGHPLLLDLGIRMWETS